MKLLDAIGKNLSLYQEMTQARVPYDFLKKQEKEVLLQFCKKVNQMHMGEIIAALQSEAIVYLIKDSVFLSFLLKLNCEDKIDTDRLSLLLAHAEEDSLLSDYKYEELYRVLTDEQIFSEWKYEYLRYYSQYGFDSTDVWIRKNEEFYRNLIVRIVRVRAYVASKTVFQSGQNQ